MKLPSTYYYNAFNGFDEQRQAYLVDQYRHAYRADELYNTAKLRYIEKLELEAIADRYKINRSAIYKRLRKFTFKAMRLGTEAINTRI